MTQLRRTRVPNNPLPILLAATLLLAPPLHGAGTPGAGQPELTAEGQDIDEAAVAWHAEGLAHKEAAWDKEARAEATASPQERDRLLAEAQADYRAAVAAHGKALKLHLDYHQAANELGYALRQTGDYRKALGAYNFALTIKPDFYPAIEYRGEAYLALGMLEEAKAAYLTLFRHEPGLAARLLAAMEDQAPADATFGAWVNERKRLAEITPTNAGASNADW